MSKQMIVSLAPVDQSNTNPIPRCRGFVAMLLWCRWSRRREFCVEKSSVVREQRRACISRTACPSCPVGREGSLHPTLLPKLLSSGILLYEITEPTIHQTHNMCEEEEGKESHTVVAKRPKKRKRTSTILPDHPSPTSCSPLPYFLVTLSILPFKGVTCTICPN
jgi:hypothetical protein